MPYHDNKYKPDSPEKTTEKKEELIALPGFHYMPDGTLMSNVEHEELYGGEKVEVEICEKTGKSIDLTKTSKSEVAPKGHVWKLCGVNVVTNYGPNQTGTWTIPTVNIIRSLAIGSYGFLPMPFGSPFYSYVSSLLGGINIDDEIFVDIGMLQGLIPQITPSGTIDPNAGSQITSGVCLSSLTGGQMSGIGNAFCFKYLGVYDLPLNSSSPPTQITIPSGNYLWGPTNTGMVMLPYTNLVYNISKQKCCDEGFVPPIEPTRLDTSWDCVLKVPGQIKFGHKCVQRNHGNGQFLTLQDCIHLPCSQEHIPSLGENGYLGGLPPVNVPLPEIPQVFQPKLISSKRLLFLSKTSNKKR